jgi:hypothetical protein
MPQKLAILFWINNLTQSRHDSHPGEEAKNEDHNKHGAFQV